jgi:hypothetical protein
LHGSLNNNGDAGRFPRKGRSSSRPLPLAFHEHTRRECPDRRQPRAHEHDLAKGCDVRIDERPPHLLAKRGLRLLTARFDAVLDARLATMTLPPSVARVVMAERGKLAGADLSSLR